MHVKISGRCGKRYQLEYIIIRQRYGHSIKNARTMPGADAVTDHDLVIIKAQIKLKFIGMRTFGQRTVDQREGELIKGLLIKDDWWKDAWSDFHKISFSTSMRDLLIPNISFSTSRRDLLIQNISFSTSVRDLLLPNISFCVTSCPSLLSKRPVGLVHDMTYV